MSKKKNKSKDLEKTWYLIEMQADDRVSWWDNDDEKWTTNLAKATAYLGFKTADNAIERFIHLLSGNVTVEQVPRDIVIERTSFRDQQKLNSSAGFLVRKIRTLNSDLKLSFDSYWCEDENVWTSQENATVYSTEDLALIKVGRFLKEEIIAETVELGLKKTIEATKKRSYISPGTVILDRHSWNFPVPLLITETYNDGKELAIVEAGLKKPEMLREKTHDVIELINNDIYEVIWDPDRMVIPESNEEFLSYLKKDEEESFDAVVPGSILLGLDEISSDIPYMVDRIVNDQVLFLCPGTPNHKTFSAKQVNEELNSSHWEILYDPRI
jgi:hypothetical protein